MKFKKHNLNELNDKFEKKLNELVHLGEQIDTKCWDNFTPVTVEEIEKIEKGIRRQLPNDFKYFYLKIGFGCFTNKIGGDIESPEEIIANCHASYYFVSGSMIPGKEWASNEEQRRFYISYGKYNPNSTLFSKDSMYLEDIFLLDLVQIGSDGTGSYHQLNVGAKAKYKYCLLTESQEIDNKSHSFFSGLKNHFNRLSLKQT